MSEVNEIRRIQYEAVSKRERKEKSRKQREQKEKEAQRAHVMSQASHLFDEILPLIELEAKQGNSSYHHSYDGDFQQARFVAEAIADEAEKRGFRAEFKQERSNMGDSAAPGWTTFYWLDISWK